jgi:hypothetical protein
VHDSVFVSMGTIMNPWCLPLQFWWLVRAIVLVPSLMLLHFKILRKKVRFLLCFAFGL